MRKMVHRKVEQSKTVAMEVGVSAMISENMMPEMFADLLLVVVVVVLQVLVELWEKRR
jgi:hypothetical protein